MQEDTFHLGIKAFIRNEEGYALFLRASSAHAAKPYWDLPGGRMHRGVSVEDTLRREVEEEIGVQDIQIGRQLGTILTPVRISLKTGGDVGLILSIYECRIPTGAELRLSDEHTDSEWCSPDETLQRLAEKFPAEFCEQIVSL